MTATVTRGLTRRFTSSTSAPNSPPPPRPRPHDHDYTHLLRSCQTLNHLHQIHARLTVLGHTHPSTPTTPLLHLINSYSSFHKLDTVLSIFHSLLNPTPPLWNSLVRAHTNAGQHKEAIQLYHQMVTGDVVPDKYTFTFVLKACAGVPDAETGVLVHREVVRRGLEGDVYIRTALIDMYSKSGLVQTAHELFESMREWDIVSWNAMIAGFAQSGKAGEALRLFRQMQSAGVDPNSVTLLNLFPAICDLAATLLCRALHGFVIRRQIFSSVCNGLVDTYSKCGDVEVARRVFDGMVGSRDDISWGTMISGYVQNDCFPEALDLFDELKLVDAGLNVVSVVSAIIAATEMDDFGRGVDIHAYATLNGVDKDIMVVTSLITMYAKCDNIKTAKHLFHTIQDKDMVAWSAMLSAFAQTGHLRESLSLFSEMQRAGMRPNRIALVSVLPACAELLDLRSGKSIHSYALKYSDELDQSTGTALVAMYAKCGCFSSAHILFDSLPHKDIVTWNALINGYAQIGDGSNAMKMFHQLRSSGLHPDSGTMVGVLPASALLNAINQGMSVHGVVVKGGFEYDLHVNNAIVDMYAKCGSLKTAEYLFNETRCPRDIISWNTMIAAYVHNGCAKEAISVYNQLKTEGLKPNLVTLISILPAAAGLAALKEGMILHSSAISAGFGSHLVVGNSLIDMYSKCGRLDCAQDIFDHMSYKDIVSWNTMITGYAIHGMGESAVALFSKMREGFIEADTVSFVGVLSACRHGGLLEQGRQIFQSMRSEHHFEPKLEHYACMVDLFGRADQLGKAWDLIQEMPMKPDASVWGAFLDACRVHSDIRMARMALDQLAGLEAHNAAPYVALSTIYAQLGRWADSRKIRKIMRYAGLSKTPGCSWLDIKNSIPAF